MNTTYTNGKIIEIVLKKTKALVHSLRKSSIDKNKELLQIIEKIAEQNKIINVIDFGGACGGHYFAIRSRLNANIILNWVVVETSAMVNAARELETDEISFSDDFSAAVSGMTCIHLLHTSGALQCVDNPYDTLEMLLNCNAEFILFNRLGLNEFECDITIQHSAKIEWHGEGNFADICDDAWVSYPLTFIREKMFLHLLSAKYNIVKKIPDESGVVSVQGERIIGYGLLCSDLATIY